MPRRPQKWLASVIFAAGLVLAHAVPSAGQAPAAADVKLHDTLVFRVLVGHGGKSAKDRAEAAGRALEHALGDEDPRARRELQGSAHVIFAADRPVIELYAEDAAAAGDATLEVHSARVLARTRDALHAEKKRSDIAQTVFSISIVVFLGLLALFLLRAVGDYAERARKLIDEHPERIPSLHVRSIEVLGRGALRATLLGALIVVRAVLQVGIVYAWLVVSLGLFEATRPYVARLTGLFTKPLLSLVERFAFALPLALLAACFGALVYVVVRFVELFFVSVRRGETRLGWLPSELVAPASVLTRAVIVLLALVFAGPILTGDSDGALARAGAILLVSLGLAAAPLLASAWVGVMQLLSRRVRIGSEITIGSARGRVTATTIFDTTLTDADGHTVRVPHLVALFTPLRERAGDARTSVTICVAAGPAPSAVRALLLETVSGAGARAEVELHDIDASGAHFRVSLAADDPRVGGESELRILLAEALGKAGFALGHSRGRVP